MTEHQPPLPPLPPPGNPLPLPPQAPQAPRPADDIEWKRPHPYTLLIEFVSSVRDLIFPIVIVLSQGGSGGALATEIIPVLAIMAPVGFAVARYYSTRYALTDEALLHNYGVISKNRQVLPRRNIQNLSTSAGLIARATGLMELTVSDASQGGDVNLRLLSVEDAEELMTLLRREAREPASAPSGTPLPDSSLPEMAAPSGASAYVADPIHSLDLMDLVKLRVVTSVGPLLALFALVVLGAVVLSFPDVTRDVTGEMSWGGVIFILAPMAAGFVAAVAPVLALGGFRLWSDPDRLRIKTGLLTEVQVNARRERLQLVEVNRHIAAQRLGLEAIRFETADVEGGNAGVNYLAPAVAKDSWPRYAADALGDVELGEADLARVSPLTKRRSRVRFAMAAVPFVLAVTVLIVVASGGNRTILVSGFVVLIIGYVSYALWYSRRRAERLGWAVGPEQFLFRTGVIGERLILVRKDKLQILRLDQSFFQRRLRLASVQVGTAGVGLRGVVSLPDLELDTASDLLQHLAEASATTPLAQTL